MHKQRRRKKGPSGSRVALGTGEGHWCLPSRLVVQSDSNIGEASLQHSLYT